LKVSQCSTGIRPAVANVAGRVGKAASADGKRKATISIGDGVAERSDPALKLIPKLARAAKLTTMRQANTSLPALTKT